MLWNSCLCQIRLQLNCVLFGIFIKSKITKIQISKENSKPILNTSNPLTCIISKWYKNLTLTLLLLGIYQHPKRNHVIIKLNIAITFCIHIQKQESINFVVSFLYYKKVYSGWENIFFVIIM